MPKMTPEQEAKYALSYGGNRQDLPIAAQLVYDLLKAEREAAGVTTPDSPPRLPPRTPPRSSPETRANILEMFKRTNSKYAKPFEKDRLAVLSVMGGNWEEYGQIILQMAILETLLSIEEKLSEPSTGGHSAAE